MRLRNHIEETHYFTLHCVVCHAERMLDATDYYEHNLPQLVPILEREFSKLGWRLGKTGPLCSVCAKSKTAIK